MNYIYDIIVNFTDINLFYDSYEWKNNDHLINVRKAPVFKVSTNVIEDFINYKIKINKSFLKKINNQFILFKKDKTNISYMTILSNGEKSIAISIDSEGYIIYKSSLLFDEEMEANRIVNKLNNYEIKYLKCSKFDNKLMLRDDIVKKNYLIKEIKKLYKTKKYDKLKYFYYEIFDNLIEDKKTVYEKLLECINDYTYEYENIYTMLKDQHKFIEN